MHFYVLFYANVYIFYHNRYSTCRLPVTKILTIPILCPCDVFQMSSIIACTLSMYIAYIIYDCPKQYASVNHLHSYSY